MLTPEREQRRFVIFAMARTGSGLLVRLLDSHPQIKCHKELFHAKHIGYFKDEQIDGRGIRTPGLIPEHRETFLYKWTRAMDKKLSQVEAGKMATVTGAVIGSGSAAVKTALWMKEEIREKLKEMGHPGISVQVNIIPGKRAFLEEHSPAAKVEVEREFTDNGIQVQPSLPIMKVNQDGVQLSDGSLVESDIVIIVGRMGGPCPDFNESNYPRLSEFLAEARFYDDPGYRDRNPERFLRMFFEKNKNEADLVGFKLMLVQNEEAKRICAGDPELKKIVLRRENLLATFSSGQIMKKARQSFMNREDIRRSGAIKADFNSRHFETYRKKVYKLYDDLGKMKCAGDKNWLNLEYKDLNDTQTHQVLCNFLDVKIIEQLRSSSKKVNTSNILDRFANPDTVWKHLKKIDQKEWAEE